MTIDDADQVFRLYSDPEVCRYYDLAPFVDPGQGRDHVERWLSAAAQRKQFRWVIDAGEFAGTVGLYSLYWHQRRASLGFDLLPSFWGKGIMGQALDQLLNLAGSDLGLHRIQALVLPGNEASRRVLLRKGFACEGLLRDYEEWEGKGFVDLEMWARIL